MPHDLSLLDDIIAAADDVAEFCSGLDLELFAQNKPLRYAILHSLTIIGEAANRVSTELKEANPGIPWRRIVAFRHRIVHGYGGLDLELVWQVARVLVPELRHRAAAIRAQFPPD